MDICRENMLQEMGVAVRQDGNAVGVFSPKKVIKIYKNQGCKKYVCSL